MGKPWMEATVKTTATGVILAFSVCSCSKEPAPRPAPVPASAPASQDSSPTSAHHDDKPSKVDIMDKLSKLSTFTEAVEAIKPIMSDTHNELSPGAAQFALWAAGHLKWDDVVVKKNETSIALVRKDSDEERGKRMCVSGFLIEIAVEKTLAGKVTSGLLMTSGRDLIHFAAVGSSGTLVEHSSARLCGVVIGRFDYSNSGGGVGHAVQMVGIFDLRENHPGQKTKREKDAEEGGYY